MQRLKTEIYIQAYLRRCQAAGTFATIARRGDRDAGVIAVKIFAGKGLATGFIESRDQLGEMAWRPLSAGLVAEQEIDARLLRETKFDADMWIVEVEDAAGRDFLQEKKLDLI